MADNVNKLLIFEHDAAVVALFSKAAEDAGYAVASAASGAAFVQLLESFHPTLIVIGANLPDTNSSELLASLAARACTANILLISSGDGMSAAAHELGAGRGLAKAPANCLESIPARRALCGAGVVQW